MVCDLLISGEASCLRLLSGGVPGFCHARKGKMRNPEGLSFYGGAGNGSLPEKVFAALVRMQALGKSFRLKGRRPVMRGRMKIGVHDPKVK